MRLALRTRLAVALEAGSILVAVLLFALPPPAAWVDGPYTHGFYEPLQRAVTGISNLVPFALGDVFLAGVIIALAVLWVRALRRERSVRSLGRAALRTASLVAILYLWFLIAWGWNYNESPLYQRLGYDGASVDRLSIDRIEDDTVAALNALAPVAHAEHDRAPDLRAQLDAVYRGTLTATGIDPGVRVTVPKHTLLDPYFVVTGIAGMFFPFTFETYLSSDVLWYEYPFNLAHEWSHLAGVSRESDANFMGAYTTLRSGDVVLRYSGVLIVFAAMPRLNHADKSLSKLVLSDYAGMRARNDRNIKPIAFNFAWKTYDKYLKSQHVASGVVNYTEYVKLLLGTPAGRAALGVAIGKPVTPR